MEKARRLFNHWFLGLALALSSSLMLSEQLVGCSMHKTAVESPATSVNIQQSDVAEFRFDDHSTVDNPDKG